jgi:hypothetical protein
MAVCRIDEVNGNFIAIIMNLELSQSRARTLNNCYGFRRYIKRQRHARKPFLELRNEVIAYHCLTTQYRLSDHHDLLDFRGVSKGLVEVGRFSGEAPDGGGTDGVTFAQLNCGHFVLSTRFQSIIDLAEARSTPQNQEDTVSLGPVENHRAGRVVDEMAPFDDLDQVCVRFKYGCAQAPGSDLLPPGEGGHISVGVGGWRGFLHGGERLCGIFLRDAMHAKNNFAHIKCVP